jgi:hypothetical protein
VSPGNAPRGRARGLIHKSHPCAALSGRHAGWPVLSPGRCPGLICCAPSGQSAVVPPTGRLSGLWRPFGAGVEVSSPGAGERIMSERDAGQVQYTREAPRLVKGFRGRKWADPFPWPPGSQAYRHRASDYQHSSSANRSLGAGDSIWRQAPDRATTHVRGSAAGSGVRAPRNAIHPAAPDSIWRSSPDRAGAGMVASGPGGPHDSGKSIGGGWTGYPVGPLALWPAGTLALWPAGTLACQGRDKAPLARPLPACPAGETVRRLESVVRRPRGDPCRLVRQVKQFGGFLVQDQRTYCGTPAGSSGR